MPLPIEDYALIGDTHSAALVGKDGSIDWFCAPRFDSPACFAALLGTPENGRWRFAPAEEVRTVRRRYRPGTLVLETEFETGSGCVRLIDFMPLGEDEHAISIMRLIEGVEGAVPMAMELIMRFDYGILVPWVRRQNYGLNAIAGPEALILQTAAPLENHEFRTESHFTIGKGDCLPFTLTWCRSHERRLPLAEPFRAMERTETRWRDWAGRYQIESPWREQVNRSLITLKALTYAPTGGILAAATTSLPEKIGGDRNWDYRYCWIRDATFMLFALVTSGYRHEARAWREWLLRAAAGKPAQLQIMYGPAGEHRLREWEVPWLAGYKNSAPVRIGNAAADQLQLDVYGEILDAFYQYSRHDVEPWKETWRLEKVLMQGLERAWRSPDNGIWEVRGPPRHFTHSKVMAWVAVDRAIKSVERLDMDGDLERWRALRAEIHHDVCQKGFNSERNAFVQFYGSDALDASLLMIPLVGFLPANDPRVIGTVEAIERDLVRHGLVLRYITDPAIDGLPEGEGAFLACSFWLVDVMVMMGRHEEARALFERLIALCNDVGLLAEEYDPRAGRQLGNFPQVLSHVALINSAHNLAPYVRGPAAERAE